METQVFFNLLSVTNFFFGNLLEWLLGTPLLPAKFCFLVPDSSDEFVYSFKALSYSWLDNAKTIDDLLGYI